MLAFPPVFSKSSEMSGINVIISSRLLGVIANVVKNFFLNRFYTIFPHPVPIYMSRKNMYENVVSSLNFSILKLFVVFYLKWIDITFFNRHRSVRWKYKYQFVLVFCLWVQVSVLLRLSYWKIGKLNSWLLLTSWWMH